MQTKDATLNYFAYHPATEQVAATFDEIRKGFVELAGKLFDLLPDGPDKTTALRQLHVASMQAISAVAMTTPADWENPHVARVLPTS